MAVVAGELAGGDDLVGPVERADGDGRQIIAPLVGQWRPTLATEAALHLERRAELRRPAARPGDGRVELGPGAKQIAHGLLTHAAIADGRMAEMAVDAVADGATLAAAGEGVTHGAPPAKRSVASIR
jgi:hypothetical protein